MTTYTSIQILPQTRERLASLKIGRESYDELLNKLVELVPSGDDEGEYTDEFKAKLLEAKMQTREGKTHSLAEVKRTLGL